MTPTRETTAPAGPFRRGLLELARRFGCTEGQLQTIAIGLLVAVTTAAIGLPPVFEDRPIGELAAPEPAPAASGASPAPDDDPVAPPMGDGPMTGPGPTERPGRSVDRPIEATAPPEGADAPTGGGNDQPERPAAPRSPGRAGSSVELAGQAGPCALEQRSIENPRRVGSPATTPVWIFEPSGSRDTPIAGGACDDANRPVVLFAHGFGQTDPSAYQALLDHLVSVGNIVVYPVYEVSDGERSSLEESHRVVDAGFVAAIAETPRVDTTRVGIWGHSHGGGMVAFLTQQIGDRGWGETSLWLSNVAQAFTQLVGSGDIPVPRHARAITVAFQHDAFADARLGIDVFRSLVLPAAQKRHVTVLSDLSTGVVADHGAPSGTAEQADAIDRLLWRYADLLQLCAIHGDGCDADLSSAPGPDGNPVRRATVSDDPVDVGPYPAILAECDFGFGLTLNPRIQRCGPTKL